MDSHIICDVPRPCAEGCCPGGATYGPCWWIAGGLVVERALIFLWARDAQLISLLPCWPCCPAFPGLGLWLHHYTAVPSPACSKASALFWGRQRMETAAKCINYCFSFATIFSCIFPDWYFISTIPSRRYASLLRRLLYLFRLCQLPIVTISVHELN